MIMSFHANHLKVSRSFQTHKRQCHVAHVLLSIHLSTHTGVNQTYTWRVSDSLKLLVSQSLLLHVTTYIRRRLRKARYPNIRIETVLMSLRMTLGFLVAQGEGPSPPIPHLTEAKRGGLAYMRPTEGRLPWDYDYLRTSLRRLLENLLDILYHLVAYRVELDPDFPKQRVHAELIKALQGHDEWLERQAQIGAFPFLKITIEATQDRLRV